VVHEPPEVFRFVDIKADTCSSYDSTGNALTIRDGKMSLEAISSEVRLNYSRRMH
jgi:hypothetical protein